MVVTCFKNGGHQGNCWVLIRMQVKIRWCRGSGFHILIGHDERKQRKQGKREKQDSKRRLKMNRSKTCNRALQMKSSDTILEIVSPWTRETNSRGCEMMKAAEKETIEKGKTRRRKSEDVIFITVYLRVD